MNFVEFGQQCQPLNKEYYKIFNYIPVPDDYLASRERYLAALKEAVEKKIELCKILKKVDDKLDPNSLY